jgi:kinesin family protein 5
LTSQQGTFSEKDEQLRVVLAKLDTLDPDASLGPLTGEDLSLLRRQLSEAQAILRDTVDRLRQSQEENDHLLHQKKEIEARLGRVETEYEELLEKAIHEEETNNADLADTMSELKVGIRSIPLGIPDVFAEQTRSTVRSQAGGSRQ